MDAADFYLGSKKAFIRAEDIDARCYQAMRGRTADEMNHVFEMYYAAFQTANNITALAHNRDASYKILQKFQGQIWADLRDAADKGWFGANMDARSFGEIFEPTTSLHGVFRHLARNNGHWKADDGAHWKPGSFGCDVKVPPGINAFYDAIEERGTEVVTNYHDWQKSRANLERAKAENDWHTFGLKVKTTGWVLEKVGPKMWSMAKAPEELMEKVEKRFSLIAKCCDLASDVQEYMETYNTIANTGTRDEKLQKLVAETAAMIVKKVPIFGDAYGSVIQGIPGLISWAQRVAKEHYGAYAMPSNL
jgi:hypothetical protein